MPWEELDWNSHEPVASKEIGITALPSDAEIENVPAYIPVGFRN